jgi:hypothetical protein
MRPEVTLAAIGLALWALTLGTLLAVGLAVWF